MKLVSVLMPVFNCERYIAEAIQSILDQTYTNFELLILDDCSTDETSRVVSSFNDKRIRYYRNYKNMGIVNTLNAHLRKCRGELTARMDGDDIAHYERLEKQVRYMHQHPDVGLIGSWYFIRNEMSGELLTMKRFTDDLSIRFHMIFRNQFLHPGIMIRTPLIKKLMYREVTTCEDYDLWARCLRHTKVANYPEFLMIYRWHGNNISLINQPSLRKSKMLVISEILTEYGIDYTKEELMLQTMIALSFNREQLITLGKLKPMENWLNKLSRSKELFNLFGSDIVSSGIKQYYAMFDLSEPQK